jgi:opacity protein-like surface antigen
MKKLVILTLVAVLLTGVAFAKDGNGALAAGIVLEAAKDSSGQTISNSKAGPKFSGLFDIGVPVFGPLYAGFELQGTYRQQASIDGSSSQTFLDTYFISDDAFLTIIKQSKYTTNLTYYETDISPRVYASLDIGEDIQALAFLGASKNVNSYDYTVTAASNGAQGGTGDTTTYSTGQLIDSLSQKNVPVSESPWFVVAGVRGSFSLFYVDYTRYLRLKNGVININDFSRDILGAGITLRW